MSVQRYAQLTVALCVVPACIWWYTIFTQGFGSAILSPYYWTASLPLVLLQVRFWLSLK